MSKWKEKVNQLKQKTSQVYIALKSKKTPWYAKVFAAITVIYALSPIDLIPDFIPILGQLDDLILLPLFIYLTIRLIPKEIWNSYEEEAKQLWKDGKPKKWIYAIPFVIFWLLIVGLVVWLIVKNCIK
jgi:uncharacterized membrane protein YkvA (DUF1232 family)